MKLVLLVEDDPERAAKIQSCVPAEMRCIWARSAGVAIGILRRDTFSALLLDHDLEPNSHTSGLDGQAVVKIVCETQPRDTCSVFVHSQNRIGGPAMVTYLQQRGFKVERCSWCDEALPVIQEWLESIRADE